MVQSIPSVPIPPCIYRAFVIFLWKSCKRPTMRLGCLYKSVLMPHPERNCIFQYISCKCHVYGKISDNLIKMREASFAKSLAAIAIISPDVTTRTKPNVLLIEHERMTKFGTRTQSNSHQKKKNLVIELNRTLIEFYCLLGSMVEVGMHSIKNGTLYRKIARVLLNVSFF